MALHARAVRRGPHLTSLPLTSPPRLCRQPRAPGARSGAAGGSRLSHLGRKINCCCTTCSPERDESSREFSLATSVCHSNIHRGAGGQTARCKNNLERDAPARGGGGGDTGGAPRSREGCGAPRRAPHTLSFLLGGGVGGSSGGNRRRRVKGSCQNLPPSARPLLLPV